jgi:hypothetical protein
MAYSAVTMGKSEMAVLIAVERARAGQRMFIATPRAMDAIGIIERYAPREFLSIVSEHGLLLYARSRADA